MNKNRDINTRENELSEDVFKATGLNFKPDADTEKGSADLFNRIQKQVKDAARIQKRLRNYEFKKRNGLDTIDMIGILLGDGKGSLPHDSRSILDLVISPYTVKNLNYIHGSTPEEVTNTLLAIFSEKAADGANAYFYTNAHTIAYYGMVFHIALIEYTGASKSPNAYFNTMMDFCKPYEKIKSDDPDAEPIMTHPIFDRLGFQPELYEPGTELYTAMQKFVEYSQIDAETKSKFTSTVNSWLNEFQKSSKLIAWTHSEESDIDIENILKLAHRYGLALSETLYGRAGLAIQALMKSRLYSAVKKRENLGLKRVDCGHSKVVVLMDECHSSVTKEDLAITPIGRSLDIISIYATQTFEGLLAKMSQNEATAFMETFGTIGSFNSSPATLELVRQRVGKSKILVNNLPGEILDLGNTATIHMGSPYFDQQNPYSKWMRAISRKANFMKWFALTKNTDYAFEPISPKGNSGLGTAATLSVSKEAQFVVTDKDLQKLKNSFTAICDWNRGDINRHDFLKTLALDENFKPIDTSKTRNNKILDKAKAILGL